MPLALGSHVGPYEILGNLGAGGMGEVYRARDPRIGRDVAIKVLPRSLSGNADHLRRFEQEARATGTLNHPNLLTIFDLGTHDGGPFIVSELLDGATLRDTLAGGRLPIRKVLDYAVQIANGLAAAHEKGVVHRDIKPENVFITADDRVKLLDFGLAKLLTPDQPEGSRADTQNRGTSPGVIVGTVGYMSPEQVRGSAIDHRSDIFSFAIVLYEMLTGIQPFRRDSSVETMNAILHDDPPVLSEESIPPVLTRLLEHAMEKNPSRRFESMKDVAFALDAISGSGESSAAKPRAKPRRKAERPKQLTYSRITFRRGFIMSARFSPDGTIVYGAAWEDRPLEIFSSHPATPESRPLGLPNADVLSISPTGELALSLGRHYVAGYVTSGTLARMPLGGTVPRAVCDDVQDASWTRDGKELIVSRAVGGRYRIESPIGNVLYESSNWISNIRPSPDNDRFAFVDHPLYGDDGGSLVVIDRNGKSVMRSRQWSSTSGLAWTPKGDEVWMAGQGSNAGRDIFAFNMSGRERVVLPVPGRLTVHDIADDGRVLVAFESGRRETVAGRRGEELERNLSWFDWTFLNDISDDGKLVLLAEQAAAVRGRNTIYLRPTDGGPAIRIGEGQGRGRPFSRDGKWIVAQMATSPSRIEILPVGTGQSRTIPMQQFENVLAWQLFPDNQRLAVLGQEPGQPIHLFEVMVDGSKPPRQISRVNVSWPVLISNDSQTIASMGPEDRVLLFPVDGGEARIVDSCGPGDVPIAWTPDDRALWVYRRARVSVTIDQAAIDGNDRKPWHTIRPTDPAGILDIFPVHITSDGQTYAYGYRRVLSDLYVVTGLI